MIPIRHPPFVYDDLRVILRNSLILSITDRSLSSSIDADRDDGSDLFFCDWKVSQPGPLSWACMAQKLERRREEIGTFERVF